ncbi:MAG: phosphatase PAP2 family protein [Cellvibrionaceae bacterium]
MRLIQNASNYDHKAFSWCQQRRHKGLLIFLARYISRTADGHAYFLIGCCAYLQNQMDFLKLGMLCFLVERITYYLIKKNIKRHRPPDAIPGFNSIIQASDKFSFPSGHTSAAFLMATMMALFSPWTACLFFPWAISVAVSRVLLGVHFPGDTLAGSIMGSAITLLCFAVLF